MNLIENVYEIAESFMNDSTEVKMNHKKIEQIAIDMLSQGPIIFPLPNVESRYKTTLLELVAASINYCYWYGKSTIRPNDVNSTFMYENLMNAFFDYSSENYQSFDICITRFINLLIINRFPLIEERICHLNQLRHSGELFVRNIVEENVTEDIDKTMKSLITEFPGFASDIFLKRASLFFIQLNRRFGWYIDAVKKLHVPADYQIPKMLEYFGCISYSKSLKNTIKTNKLIAKNSVEECEIRSATILTVKKLCELTGWGVSEVDGYFFLRRHKVTTPFHLTITTDY